MSMSRIKRIKRLVAALVCAVWLLVTLAAPGAAQAQSPIKVVASFSILGDFVRNVGGDKIALNVIVPPGGDAHTFEPSPADSILLSEAALLFEIGAEFESWLDKLYAASGSKAVRVVMTEGMELLKFEGEHGHEHEGEHGEHKGEAAPGMPGTPEATAEAKHGDEHGHEHEHEHEHGEFDPHVWHDVTLAMKMVEKIRDALAQADPTNAESYQANAAAYLKELEALDAFVKAEVEKLPAERRKLITTHDTFAYFGARYGFEVDSALGVTTEAADPSPAQIGELIEKIRASGVPAVFADNVTNPQLMEQIAREAGVTLGPKLYTDALGEPGSEGETFVKLMRYNVTAIVGALGR